VSLNLGKEAKALTKRDLLKLVGQLERKHPFLRTEIQEFLKQVRRSPSALIRRFGSCLRRKHKRPGRKPGHPGVTRPKPDHIDRVVDQTLTHCTHCRTPLGKSLGASEHTQEDLIPARVEATCFRHHRYWCPGCRDIITAPPAPDEIPDSYLGPAILTHTILFKYVHGLPFNKIETAFQQLAGLDVSQGGLAQALQRIARWLQVETEELLKAVRSSPAVHIDETGWKITGQGHWLWAFVTQQLAYYRTDRSRGSGVPKEVLGPDYKGTLITDFFSAYNRFKVKQQKCWVHLLRELRGEAKENFSEEFRKAHRRLRRIFLDARRLARERKKLPAGTLLRRYRLLSDRLLAWGAAPYRDKTLKRLSERVLKHHHQLLTFLEQPGLPMDNNHAERLIRPHVIIRNRSYQSRSPTGARTHGDLMSWVQTLALQGKAIGPTLGGAYVRHRQGDRTPILLPAG
jgi:transposase